MSLTETCFCLQLYGTSKVRSLTEHSCAILISFKKNSEIQTKSADVILKMTTILKEMRIAQLCSKVNRLLRVFHFSKNCSCTLKSCTECDESSATIWLRAALSLVKYTDQSCGGWQQYTKFQTVVHFHVKINLILYFKRQIFTTLEILFDNNNILLWQNVWLKL